MAEFPSELMRIIQGAMIHDNNMVKRYARRLAAKYEANGEKGVSDCILGYIGDKEIPMATMDSDIEIDEHLDAKNDRVNALLKLKEHVFNLCVERWQHLQGIYSHFKHAESEQNKFDECNDELVKRFQDYDQFMYDYQGDWDLNYQDYGLDKVYNKN